MVEFEQATHAEPLGDGQYRVVVPDGWQHGRGAFGGLVLATLLRAMQAEDRDARPVRTFYGDICGPVTPGEATIKVALLRRGSNQTNLRADLMQGGQFLATGAAVLSNGRQGSMRVLPARPPEADWRTVPVLPLAPPFASPFTVHYEYRSTGPAPLSGAADPVTMGFIREREPPARLDAPAIVGRLDAYWPTIVATTVKFPPMATISFLAELFVDPVSLDPSVPLRHLSRAVHVGEGFLLEQRELWSGDLPVAMNQQTFAVMG